MFFFNVYNREWPMICIYVYSHIWISCVLSFHVVPKYRNLLLISVPQTPETSKKSLFGHFYIVFATWCTEFKRWLRGFSIFILLKSYPSQCRQDILQFSLTSLRNNLSKLLHFQQIFIRHVSRIIFYFRKLLCSFPFVIDRNPKNLFSEFSSTEKTLYLNIKFRIWEYRLL